MGFRFRNRIKIFPGLWINLGKSGVSTSIGGKGLTVNLKGGKTKMTIGIPGTGLSYSETSTSAPSGSAPERPFIPAGVWLVLIVIIALVILWKYIPFR
jgi:hypothetical protein